MLPLAHDHQIRTLLHQYLKLRLGASDRLVDELLLAFGEARADVALVNGHLEGFEIKADLDTLTRLPAQIEAYDKVFDFAWVITTSSHLDAVRAIVPRGWGLMIATVRGAQAGIRQVRQARHNTRRDASHLVRLLWRDEVLAKLEELGLSRGLKSKPKIALFAALSQAMPVDGLADYVRTCLKARTSWRVDEARRAGGDSLHPGATT